SLIRTNTCSRETSIIRHAAARRRRREQSRAPPCPARSWARSSFSSCLAQASGRRGQRRLAQRPGILEGELRLADQVLARPPLGPQYRPREAHPGEAAVGDHAEAAQAQEVGAAA